MPGEILENKNQNQLRVCDLIKFAESKKVMGGQLKQRGKVDTFVAKH
jgi:hypothetical protein